MARSTGLDGQVSKLAMLVKNFLAELARSYASWLRLFKSDTDKAVCLFQPHKQKPISGLLSLRDLVDDVKTEIIQMSPQQPIFGHQYI